MRVIKISAKLLFLSLFLIGVGLVVTQSSFAQNKGQATPSDASILLEPAFQQLKMKEEFQVAVVINSTLPLAGADAKISYDPRVIEVVSIEEGDTFRNIPLKAINKGVINITALAEKKEEFTGTGTLVTLNLKAKDAGDTNLIIAFSPGDTADSNLTQVPPSDVLAKVEVGHYLIGSPMQRTTGAVKRFLFAVFPYAIFLIFLVIAGYFGYRWYKTQKAAGPAVFIPEEVPLDQPPMPQESVNPPAGEVGPPSGPLREEGG